MIYFVAITISCLVALKVKQVGEKLIYTENRKTKFNRNKGRDIAFTILASMPLFLLSALRYGIGTDYFYGYVPIFNWVLYGNSNQTQVEEGYILLNRIVCLFTNNYQWIFALTSLIYIGCVFYAIYKMSLNMSYSILLFFLSYNYLNSYNVVRQQMAMGIVLTAFVFLEDKPKLKNYIIYLLLVLLAGSFHRSAFIAMIFPIMMNIRTNALYLFFISVFILLIKDQVISFLLAHGSSIHQRYAVYIGSLSHSELSIQFLFFNTLFFLLILYIDIKNKNLKNDKQWNLIKWLQFVTVIFYSAQGMIPYISRVVLYFTFPQILFLPNAVNMHWSKKERKWMYFMITMIFFVDFFYNYYKGYGEARPYRSIFNK